MTSVGGWDWIVPALLIGVGLLLIVLTYTMTPPRDDDDDTQSRWP